MFANKIFEITYLWKLLDELTSILVSDKIL